MMTLQQRIRATLLDLQIMVTNEMRSIETGVEVGPRMSSMTGRGQWKSLARDAEKLLVELDPERGPKPYHTGRYTVSAIPSNILAHMSDEQLETHYQAWLQSGGGR